MEIKETYQSPRWTGEIADCSLPVTLDTYSNCSFGCIYCFSQYRRTLGNYKEEYLSKGVRCIPVEQVKKLFAGKIPRASFTGGSAKADRFSTAGCLISLTGTSASTAKRMSC